MSEYPNNVTPAEVLSTLREVVQGKEDYLYQAPDHQRTGGNTCFYVHRDAVTDEKTPGCLVGHVLNRLGVPLSELAKCEGTRASIVIEHLQNEEQNPVNAYIRRTLDKAQQIQDNSGTWGEALREAETVPLPTV